MKISPLRPTLAVSVLAMAFVAAIAMAGVSCSSNNSALPVTGVTPSPSPSVAASGSPTPTPTPTPMNNVSVSYQASPVPNGSYGPLDGYGLMSGPPIIPSPSASSSPAVPTPAPQSVVAVHVGQTIVFFNFETVRRTAALMGPANGTNWPTTFNNTTCSELTATSPAGSAITDTQFCAVIPAMTGLGPGQSLGYVTGAVTGSFYFGDATNYCAPQCGNAASPNPSMRTVITINP